MDFEKNVQAYFKNTLRSEKPLLLGFSGGEDSLALAHCLIRLKIPFHIAHFDHAWRKESCEEATALQVWATGQGLPFYTKRSNQRGLSELAAREERYDFFQALFKEGQFQALLLAHHRDDQVETILKRVFEGAQLPTLKGMGPFSQKGDLLIYRPLLGTSKETIRAYLKLHQLKPIEDYTNWDEKYLRARMRGSLIPKLQENFGKEISNSILRLGEYSAELADYLTLKTENLLPIEGPFGTMWDFSNSHPIEIRFVLGQFFRKQDLMASQPIFEQIFLAISTNAANYKICFANRLLIIDRKRLFFLKSDLPNFPDNIPLQEGKLLLKGWEVEIKIGKKIEVSPQNWRNWWQGKISVTIPAGSYTLQLPNSKFRKFQNNHKVPAFLRETLPMLVSEEKPIGEFLTGKGLQPSQEGALLVTFEVS